MANQNVRERRPTEAAKQLGARIRWARERAEKTQEEIALALDYSGKIVVSRWERAVRAPDLPTLIRLAELLGVGTSFLLGMTDDPDFMDPEMSSTGGVPLVDQRPGKQHKKDPRPPTWIEDLKTALNQQTETFLTALREERAERDRLIELERAERDRLLQQEREERMKLFAQLLEQLRSPASTSPAAESPAAPEAPPPTTTKKRHPKRTRQSSVKERSA